MKQYEIFYTKSKTDLAMARVAKDSGNEEIDDEVILFHLQQASEKLLKALLAYRGISVEKTHDIEALAKKCTANDIILPDFMDNLYDLSEYAVEGRYGQIHDDIGNIECYFDYVERFKKLVSNLINCKIG
jgi:HEPN domain-containing protein